jgi:hypothetical protein
MKNKRQNQVTFYTIAVSFSINPSKHIFFRYILYYTIRDHIIYQPIKGPFYYPTIEEYIFLCRNKEFTRLYVFMLQQVTLADGLRKPSAG